ncbi:flagellar protein FlaG [Thalassospira sp. HF15]|uniref:flagellar protein FlaG n=1 Tax=Thalassospira sp. HF15 TaxID=2722755 RepID=UPI00142F6DB2|nr:flagellar protein FlaG [Thalassospira sp. HF15]NIY77791.1 flagellar protein FlaG [Thalassospira sp. HF15]
MEVVQNYSAPSSPGSSTQAASAAPAVASARADTESASVKPETKTSAVPQKMQDALASLDLPDLADGSARVELNFNQDTGRVVAKVTDRVSGDVLRELPSKELQQLFSQMREYLGSFVDEEI